MSELHCPLHTDKNPKTVHEGCLSPYDVVGFCIEHRGSRNNDKEDPLLFHDIFFKKLKILLTVGIKQFIFKISILIIIII
jgi:hypothetical protein